MRRYTSKQGVVDDKYNNKLKRARAILEKLPEQDYSDEYLAAIFAEGEILEISGCEGLEKCKENKYIRILGEDKDGILIQLGQKVGFTNRNKICRAFDIREEELSEVLAGMKNEQRINEDFER